MLGERSAQAIFTGPPLQANDISPRVTTLGRTLTPHHPIGLHCWVYGRTCVHRLALLSHALIIDLVVFKQGSTSGCCTGHRTIRNCSFSQFHWQFSRSLMRHAMPRPCSIPSILRPTSGTFTRLMRLQKARLRVRCHVPMRENTTGNSRMLHPTSGIFTRLMRLQKTVAQAETTNN